MDLHEFITKWKGNTQKERSVSQEHFLDICRMFGHPSPKEADSVGTEFAFEYGVGKLSGGAGFADVFKKGCFGWEYKGNHKDLDKAYRQLQDYRVSLFNPPLLIVCDLDKFRIYTNFLNAEEVVYEFDLSTFGDFSTIHPELTNFELLRFAFTDPDRLRSGKNPLEVTEQAAENVGKVAIRMCNRGVDPLEAAHFVMKLVFIMFAEGIRLLPGQPLKKIMARNAMVAGAPWHNARVAELIKQMDGGGEYLLENIPWFNGGLFDGSPITKMQNGEIKLLQQAVKLDWRYVEPSVFGTLLERSLDPKRKQQLGAHYTGPDDIRRVIEPVVLDPLREEWIDLRSSLELLQVEDKPKHRVQTIEAFLEKLRNIRIFDPACGSGNFLYMALRAVMDLEQEVLAYAHKNQIPIMLAERVGPEILLGQEIDPYAKELASTVIWIGYIQKRIETGSYEERPVLRELDNITIGDSILADDGTMPDWPECDYIVGNPPFLGSKRMRGSLGDEYVENLFACYDGVLGKESDLCCYFHEQARRHIADGKAKAAGLLATNSIRDVYSRGVVERIIDTTHLFNVWPDLDWVLDGANVRISILCFGAQGNGPDSQVLDGEPVPQINSDLTSGVDLTKAVRLVENKSVGFMADKKNGPFDLDSEQARIMLEARGNPNGRPNSDVVRPWLNGRSFLHPFLGKQFIIDFGTEMSEQDAAQYAKPFEYVLKHVKPERMKRDERYTKLREQWWIHGSPATNMRESLAKLPRFLATVRVTHIRVFRFLEPPILPDCALIAFAIDDWYRFGILQSRVHELWALGLSSDLRGWPRYTPTTTFETFPFPRISPHLLERYPLADHTEDDAEALIAAVEIAAEELYAARDEVVLKDPDCPSYTELYKGNPPWLQLAHSKLDRAVLACYGLPQNAGKHEILEFLLEENLSRANADI